MCITIRILSKHFKMYITINDFIGEKRIDLPYPIYPRNEIAVVDIFSNNVLYRVKDDTKVLLPTGEKVEILGGVYTDEKLDSLIGSEKDKLVPRGHASKINKLEKSQN